LDFKLVKRTTISDQIFEQLKANLFDGTWKEEDKIPSENELAIEFGVSRVSVRNALSKLDTLGLIEIRHGEGSFVKKINPGIYMKNIIPYIYLSHESTKEVLEFRLTFEVGNTGLAFKHATDEGINLLKKSLDQMIKHSNDLQKFVDEDMHFHMIITQLTSNSLAIQLHYILHDVLAETIKDLTESVGTEIGIKYHSLILEKFQNGNEQEAKQAMQEHLQEILELYEEWEKTHKSKSKD
jgi:GntR family transcriptional repressor for pyruvate dehydrogenase complex